MPETKYTRSSRQQLFWDMVLGTLIYAVVLGFFNDYTEILLTKSYSTTFLVAVVMQILTYLTLQLKLVVVSSFKSKEGFRYTAAMAFGVWLIMFLSKFVFLAVIDFVFGDSVEISGFVGLVLIIVTMVVAKKLIDSVYEKLA